MTNVLSLSAGDVRKQGVCRAVRHVVGVSHGGCYRERTVSPTRCLQMSADVDRDGREGVSA